MERVYELSGTGYSFRPLGGPIDLIASNADLFQALGAVHASWARMEHTLTAVVMHVNKEIFSSELYDPDPRKEFSNKVRLLQKWQSRHPEFEPIRDDIDREFFQCLLGAADLRNQLTHGYIESYEASGLITVKSIRRSGKDTWAHATRSFHITDLHRLYDLINLGNRSLIELADFVFQTIRPPNQVCPYK